MYISCTGGPKNRQNVLSNNSVPYMVTVKVETLCSRFFAVISGTSGDIDMGSSGECLESKN